MRATWRQSLFVFCCFLYGASQRADAQSNQPAAPLNPQMQMMLAQPILNIDSPVIATASFDPPVVGLGETVIYRVTFNALDTSVHFPTQLPAPAGLEMSPSAKGSTLQSFGGAYHPVTALNFRVKTARTGNFSIPAYNAEVDGKQIQIPESRLEVKQTSDSTNEPARQLFLQTARTNVFVGERVPVTILSPGTAANAVESVTAIQFNGDGFLAEKAILRQSIEKLEVSGRTVSTFRMVTTVIPITVGEQTLTVQGFTSGGLFTAPVVISGQATIPGGIPRPVLLDSDPVVFLVRQLPPMQLPGFKGFIGDLVVDPPILSTNKLRVGDAIKLFVTFRSDDDLSRFTPPRPPRATGWQIFPPMPADAPAAPQTAAQQKNYRVTFAYTLIPMTEEPQATPSIPFSSFDPKKAAYVDLTIPGAPLTILAEGLPISTSATIWSATNETAITKKSSLSQLAESRGRTFSSLEPLQMQRSFIVLQLSPVFVLLTVWGWDRRRRYFANHPEIIRRRQALRALRREKRLIRHAASNGDSNGFLHSSVAALQIAAAPHYIAEPRALVCGEVLNLLSDKERDGNAGKLIRQLFASHDDANFGIAGGRGTPLINLAPELERILQQLEARL